MSTPCPCIEAIKETRWFQPLIFIGATGWFLGGIADWYDHTQLGAGLDTIGQFALFGAGFLALKTLEHFDLNEYLESHPELLHESTLETQQDEQARIAEQTSDDDILRVIRASEFPVVTAWWVADTAGMERRPVHQQLEELHKRGEVEQGMQRQNIPAWFC